MWWIIELIINVLTLQNPVKLLKGETDEPKETKPDAVVSEPCKANEPRGSSDEPRLKKVRDKDVIP